MDNNNTDLNSTEDRPMSSEQSTRTINNQTMSERAEKSKYEIPILSDRETDPIEKNQPQDVVGTNFGIYPSDLQPKFGRNYRRRSRIHGPPHGIPHKK